MSQDELVCTRCLKVEQENEQLRQAIAVMSEENTNLAHELAGARHTQKTLERQALRARVDDAKASKESPKAEKIRGLLEHWRLGCGHLAANVDAAGDRWKLVEKQLRRYPAESLGDAISWVAANPYRRFGKRYPTGDRTDRFSQLEHCIGKDALIEQNGLMWRRQASEVEKNASAIVEQFREVSAMEQVWARLWMDALAAIESGVDPGEPLEGFLVRRRGEQGWDMGQAA